MKVSKYARWSITGTALIGFLLILTGLFFIRFELTIRANGMVLPASERFFYAPENAMVHTIHVAQGDRVERGDLLFQLSNPDLDQRLFDVERQRLDILSELARTELALKEWTIRPAAAELITAERRMQLQGRIKEIQDDLADMFAQIREQHVVSQLDMNLREIEQIRAEIQLMEAATLAEWRAAGLPELERERILHTQAQQRQRLKLIDAEQRRITTLQDQLSIRAGIGGVVAELNARHEGMHVERGFLLARVADPESGWIVRVYAPPRNIDLVQPGLPVLIESEVFDNVLEGHAHGRVKRLVPDTRRAGDMKGYEVDIEVVSSPYPLVFGSPVHSRILLGRRNLADVFIRTAGSGRRTKENESP